MGLCGIGEPIRIRNPGAAFAVELKTLPEKDLFPFFVLRMPFGQMDAAVEQEIDQHGFLIWIDLSSCSRPGLFITLFYGVGAWTTYCDGGSL